MQGKRLSLLECAIISGKGALLGGVICYLLVQLVWAFPFVIFSVASWSFKSKLIFFVTEGGLWEFTKLGLGVFFAMTPVLWVIFFCEVFGNRQIANSNEAATH